MLLLDVVVELDDELPVVLLDELLVELLEADEELEVELVDPEAEVEVEDEGDVLVVDELDSGSGVEIVGVLVELLDELDELLELDEELEPQSIGGTAVGGTTTPATAKALMISCGVASDGIARVIPSNVTVQPVSADAAGSAASAITTARPRRVTKSDRSRRRLTAVPLLRPSISMRT